MDPGNVFLVGMMGAGKSTVGKALARRLGREFVDCDREIIKRTGVSIATIFEIEGEAGFRSRESAVLAEVAGRHGTVVATGGGAVLVEANRRLMRENGTVVYLHAALDQLHERTRRDSSRPLLAKGDGRATLSALLGARDAVYREVAHIVVESGAPSAGSLAGRIVEALEEHARLAPSASP